jgi:hypothetical protein
MHQDNHFEQITLRRGVGRIALMRLTAADDLKLTEKIGQFGRVLRLRYWCQTT